MRIVQFVISFFLDCVIVLVLGYKAEDHIATKINFSKRSDNIKICIIFMLDFHVTLCLYFISEIDLLSHRLKLVYVPALVNNMVTRGFIKNALGVCANVLFARH